MRTKAPVTLRIGHSPDADDVFMWWPLAGSGERGPRIDGGRFRFEPVLDDIESLNRRSLAGELEVTAMSCAQYPFVRERYALTSCGASMGEGIGPRLVARDALRLEDLREPGAVVAIPGIRTSAFAALSLMLGPGSFRWREVPFDEVIDRVAASEFDAGLVIHEGQLTFREAGLQLVADVGAWWGGRTGLPLPLGVNAVRRDLEEELGAGTLAEIGGVLRRSVEYALAHRHEAVGHAMRYARGMDRPLTDEFVRMYVNRWTLEFGEVGRRAVQLFLDEAHAAGLSPPPGVVEFVEAGRAD